MRKLSAIVCVATAGLWWTPSYANNASRPWAKVGDWQIAIDDSLGSGCFMVASYQDGTAVRFGIDSLHRVSYIMIGNPAWRSIQLGQKYGIDVSFDNGQPKKWISEAIGGGKATFLLLPFTNYEVWNAIARANVVIFSYHRKRMTELPLTGTEAAVASVFECQKQSGWLPGQADPFAPRNNADPFAK